MTGSGTGRRRLAPEARRDEIVAAAGPHFAARAYHEVSMAAIAGDAGVSRALVYRYFPSKRALFSAVYQRAADHLVAASAPDPSVSLEQQVETGLDAHLDFFEANARTVLVANRGELAGDAVVEEVITAELTALQAAMLDTLGLTGRSRQVAATAILGWLGFVRGVCVEWLASGALTRDEVRGMCLRTLAAALDLSAS